MREKHGATKKKRGRKTDRANIPHLIGCDACDLMF